MPFSTTGPCPPGRERTFVRSSELKEGRPVSARQVRPVVAGDRRTRLGVPCLPGHQGVCDRGKYLMTSTTGTVLVDDAAQGALPSMASWPAAAAAGTPRRRK